MTALISIIVGLTLLGTPLFTAETSGRSASSSSINWEKFYTGGSASQGDPTLGGLLRHCSTSGVCS